MSTLRLSQRAVKDLERLTQFLVDAEVKDATATLDLILDGLQVLERHPLIGRAVEHRFRELVISRGRSGYVALYEYLAVANEVRVHAVRHQREVGYGEP